MIIRQPKKIIKYYFYAMAQRVLAVAVVNYKKYDSVMNCCLFDWAVYVDSVQGVNHSEEMIKVVEEGEKVRTELAKLLFPQFDINKYRG